MMTTGWALPCEAQLGGTAYPVATDYRDIIAIMGVLEGSDDLQADLLGVLDFFYLDGLAVIPRELHREAVEFLLWFIRGGMVEPERGEKLFDWAQDEQLIAAEINRVAGSEVRALPEVHWFTFLGWFRAIGEGQFATVVGIRHKRSRGKKLDKHEQEFYGKNKGLVDLRSRYSQAEQAQRDALLKKLKGG